MLLFDAQLELRVECLCAWSLTLASPTPQAVRLPPHGFFPGSHRYATVRVRPRFDVVHASFDGDGVDGLDGLDDGVDGRHEPDGPVEPDGPNVHGARMGRRIRRRAVHGLPLPGAHAARAALSAGD